MRVKGHLAHTHSKHTLCGLIGKGLLPVTDKTGVLLHVLLEDMIAAAQSNEVGGIEHCPECVSHEDYPLLLLREV